ncbi:MAG: glycine--tRNA ligase subunit beta [Candidatus Rickettsia vulgarisii]
MSELLLELFSEEIPALMQKNAAESYKNIFTTILQENSLLSKLAYAEGFKGDMESRTTAYFGVREDSSTGSTPKSPIEVEFKNEANEIASDVQVYIGPRRIAIHVQNLPKIIPAKKTEIRGPKTSAPEAAINGFCSANNITKEHLSRSLAQGNEYYIFTKEEPETDIRTILPELIIKAICKYVWPKSMKWGSYDISWVRPLQNILCIFDGEILPIKYGHLQSNNITFGHRFISPNPITVTNFIDYQTKLQQAKIIVNQHERKELIRNQLANIAKSLNLIIKEDERLLEEVIGLAEFPVVMAGKIPEKFLQLPSEVLTSSMRTHQKYFSNFDNNGNFAPYFLFVSNMTDDKDIIISGNEKVLSARLSDALYFYNQDLSHSLESRLTKLEKITFHAGLGNMKQKIERIINLCSYLMPENQNTQIAAKLCKSDLTSEMVGEFPELQGIMGYYYAKAEGLNEQVAQAIRDHYKPQGPTDSLPSSDAAIVAIADKLDSLVGLILAGEEPSGSRDPYSLRRQALGIIRIILSNKLRINIKQLVSHAISLYENILTPKNQLQLILTFLEERAKYHFKDNFNNSLTNAVVNFDIEDDLVITEMKLTSLQKFLAKLDGDNLLTIYKRTNNILANDNIEGEVNPSDFISEYENKLFTIIKSISKQIDNNIKEKDFTKAFSSLAAILHPIDEFFDNLMVKDSDPKIAKNRLLLLKMVRQLFDKLANFNVL